MAQDSTSKAGKILRIELDGSIPKDNPIAKRIGARDSTYFSYENR